MPIDYDDRVFASISNSATGDVGAATTFHYHQSGSSVWATYQGGTEAGESVIEEVA